MCNMHLSIVLAESIKRQTNTQNAPFWNSSQIFLAPKNRKSAFFFRPLHFELLKAEINIKNSTVLLHNGMQKSTLWGVFFQ